MRHRLALIGIVAALVGLAGCHPLQHLRNIGGSCHDVKPYMKAGSIAPLKIPPGLDSPDTAEKEMFRVACDDVMARYWTRDLDNFRSMRRQLLDMWPRQEAPPPQLQRAIPPAFLLRLRDLFGSRRRA